MGISIERNGYTDIMELGYQIVTDLSLNGFEVIAVDKVATNVFSQVNSHYVLKATTQVDPLAEEGIQPWVLVLEFNNSTGYINVWTVTEHQLDNSLSITEYDTDKESGRLSRRNSNDTSIKGSYFWVRRDDITEWSCYTNPDVDVEAIPISYQLSISDHGVFFSMWAESYDNAGDCFNWFVIQRPVDCNTGLIVTDGKSPLVCVFSRHGMPNDTYINNGSASTVVDSIDYFIVRESDVNMPEPTQTAVVPTGDRFPIINPIQQVSILEDSNYVIRFPQGFNTQRYVYDYKLDLIAYTSADVLSQWSKPKFIVFGESTQRTYKAMNANFPDNKGMRILCQIDGSGFN